MICRSCPTSELSERKKFTSGSKEYLAAPYSAFILQGLSVTVKFKQYKYFQPGQLPSKIDFCEMPIPRGKEGDASFHEDIGRVAECL